ncbi:ABC transporter substrate-binding protein [Pseudonocardia saturnea]
MRRTSLTIAACAAATLLAGCFSGAPAGEDATERIRAVLPFPPVQQLSPYGDDALLLTRLGVAETLVALDDAGSPVPALAETWTRVDDLTWRFTLRSGVTFHDGTPLTAEHVAAALTAATGASPAPRALRGITLTATAEDPSTLTVGTGVADAVLPQRLSAPTLVVLAPAAYADPGSPDPTGTATGPFVLTGADGAGATLDAFATYWDGAPEAPGVDARFVPDAGARVAAIRAGEADVALALPVAQAGLLADDQLVEVPLPRDVFLHLNAGTGVFADPGLRAAVRATLQPQLPTLTESIFEGRADAARGIYGPASPWAAARPTPERAAPGTPAGQPVRLATYSDRAELPETASVIAETLRGMGFAVEETVREFSELEADLLAGNFDAVVAARSYLLDTGDPAGFLASDVTCAGGYNLSRLCDAGVDAAVAAAQTPTDVTARREAALAAEAAVLATDAVLPLIHDRARIGIATGVEGVAEDPAERRLITAETRRS